MYNNNMNYNPNLLNYNNQGNLFNNYNGINYYNPTQGVLYYTPNNNMTNYYYNNGYNYNYNNNYDYYKNNNNSENNIKKENNLTSLNNIPLLQNAKPFYPKNMRKEKEKETNIENKENEDKKLEENQNKKDENNITDTNKEINEDKNSNNKDMENFSNKDEKEKNDNIDDDEEEKKEMNNKEEVIEENNLNKKKENEEIKENEIIKDEEIKEKKVAEIDNKSDSNKLKEEVNEIKENEENKETKKEDEVKEEKLEENKENKLEENIEENIEQNKLSEDEKNKENNDDLGDWAQISIEESSDDEDDDNNNNKDNIKTEENDNLNDNKNEILKSNPETEKIDKEEIKKLLNEISFNVYHEPKNKLKVLLNNNILNQDFFIDTIYQISLEQLSFQQMYSNLFKDIYHYLSLNKNELKFFRKKLIDKCKQNLINKKICEDNRKIINNNITLIGELINSKIFPKKMGLKCLHYLLNKFNKYSTKNNSVIKYIYLECIIILLNLICSYIYNYQKERIHNEFDEEIKKIIQTLKEINKDEKNSDMPNYTKHLLSKVIEKSDNKWELPSYEQKKYASNFLILNKEKENISEENINKSFNDSSFIKEEEYDKSFNEEDEEKKEEKNENKIINDDIELETDKKSYRYNQYNTDSSYKNKYKYNKEKDNNISEWRFTDKNKYASNDFSKSSNTLSYNKKKSEFYSNSNSNIINLNNNNYKYNNYYKYNSSSNNNLYNAKYSKGNHDNNSNDTSNNNQKIVLNNLKQFRRHIDSNKYIDNFNWDDIHNLIVYEKIGMNDFIEILIESCSSFNINKQSKYYIDLYIKSIFEYYKNCFEKEDFYDIKNTVIKNLENLYNNQDNNYYLEDVWIILIYYLLDNQIMKMNDFNNFNKDSYNIKKYIADILRKIIDYNRESKKHWINELKATKFYIENRNLFDIY